MPAMTSHDFRFRCRNGCRSARGSARLGSCLAKASPVGHCVSSSSIVGCGQSMWPAARRGRANWADVDDESSNECACFFGYSFPASVALCICKGCPGRAAAAAAGCNDVETCLTLHTLHVINVLQPRPASASRARLPLQHE